MLAGDGVLRQQLCEALAFWGFAVLGPVPDELQSALVEMYRLAEDFFELPRPERLQLGNLRLFRNKVVGYRELGGGGARFLELHALAGGSGIVPGVRRPPGTASTALRIHTQLLAVARQILVWLGDHAGIPPTALLQCLDEASLGNLDRGDCGASVLRVCCYGSDVSLDDSAQDAAVSSAAAEEPSDGVLFDEHTDASYLTLAPVGVTAGLQMRHPSTEEWLDVERGLLTKRGEEGHDLLVFVGDFVEVLTKGRYTAARHRVALTAPSDASAASHRRFSMPFLVRGQPDAVIDTTGFVEEHDESVPLLRIEGMQYAALRRFLDLKGRRRFVGSRLLPPKPREGPDGGA